MAETRSGSICAKNLLSFYIIIDNTSQISTAILEQKNDNGTLLIFLAIASCN